MREDRLEFPFGCRWRKASVEVIFRLSFSSFHFFSLLPYLSSSVIDSARYAEDHTVEDTLDYVALWNSAFIESEDLKEAVMSFMQKRRPVYKNRL